jgi:hypothetical protein
MHLYADDGLGGGKLRDFTILGDCMCARLPKIRSPPTGDVQSYRSNQYCGQHHILEDGNHLSDSGY